MILETAFTAKYFFRLKAFIHQCYGGCHFSFNFFLLDAPTSVMKKS